jgi:hypothetical protein
MFREAVNNDADDDMAEAKLSLESGSTSAYPHSYCTPILV